MNTNNTVNLTPEQSRDLLECYNAYNNPAKTEAEALEVALSVALRYKFNFAQVERAFDKAKNFPHFVRFIAGLLAAKEKGATEASVSAAVSQFSDAFITDKAQQTAAKTAYFDTDVLGMVSRPLPSQATFDNDNLVAVTVTGLSVFDSLFFDKLTQLGQWADARKAAEDIVLAQAKMGGVSEGRLAQMRANAAAVAAARTAEEARRKEDEADALSSQLAGASLDGPSTFGAYTPDPAVRLEQVRQSRVLRGYKGEHGKLLATLVTLCAEKKAERAIHKGLKNYEEAARLAVSFKASVKLIGSAMAQVTKSAARAIAQKDFESQEVVAIFNFEGREINVNKAAGESIPEGLFSENDPFFTMTSEEVRSTFAEWREVNAVHIFKLSFQRNTTTENGAWTFVTPPEAIALRFQKLLETRNGFIKEYVFQEYSLEEAIADEWIKVQVSYALTTKSSAFGGAAAPNADDADLASLRGF